MVFFKNQFKSVIEWKNPDPELLMWKWDGTNDELKNASTLLINPGQAAIFVYEGEIKALHDYPGKYEIKTANVPFLTTFSKIMQGFTSEHKANIFFIRVTDFLNQKWGTKSPIKYTDPVYKFPVGLRAFGNYSLRITDPRKFFTEIASTQHTYAISTLRNIIVDRILTPLTDLLAESGFSYAEIDSQRIELSAKLKQLVSPEFDALGFEMTDFRIENTDFDQKTQERIDKISDKIADAHAINAMGNVDSRSISNYATVEQLNALNTAAANPSGMAGAGVGLGAGIGLGSAVGNMFNQQPTGGATQQNTAANTVACVSCANQIAVGAKFCPECGKPQVLTCSNCKVVSPGNTKFCPECGTKL